MIDQYRQHGLFGQGPEWPDWCFLPAAGFGFIVCDALGEEANEQSINRDMVALGTLATWRYSQGVYRFDPDFMAELTGTPLLGKLPEHQFHRLPQWCVYIETPEMDWFGEPLCGFWAHLNWNIETHATTLTFLFDAEKGSGMTLLDIGSWSIREGVQRAFGYTVEQYHRRNGPDLGEAGFDSEELAGALTPLVAMILYLCSDTPEIEHAHIPGLRPTRPHPKKTRHGWKLFPPAQVTVWKVGNKTGALLASNV